MTASEPLYRPEHIIDVLQIPLIGRLLRRKRGRLVIQIPLLILAGIMLYDGFTGPQVASQNLSTVTTWIHYRGFVILALLLAGNLFCMGCPFTIPRTLARRLSIRGRRWPKILRNKWIAIGGLSLYFWLYEWLSLWSSPWLTVWLILAYFAASFILEAVFTESAFCKYVCPLGTFNMVYSTISPVQIQVKSHDVCKTCVGHECVNGSYASQPIILIDQITNGKPVQQHQHGPDGVLGCGTLLYAPQIKSNMDCTMCLDCVRACPHQNVALGVRNPLRELFDITAWPKRWDLAFLVVMLAFAGLANAFGMTPPVFQFLEGLSKVTGIRDRGIQLLIMFLGYNLAIPALVGLGTAWISARLAGSKKSSAWRLTFTSFAPAFVPLGLGIWTAHYAFHFLNGALTIVPVLQSFLADNNLPLFGTNIRWGLGPIASVAVIGYVQFAALLGGFLVSILVARKISFQLYRKQLAAQAALLPWAVMMLGVLLFALWVFSQPMEMRGMSETENLAPTPSNLVQANTPPDNTSSAVVGNISISGAYVRVALSESMPGMDMSSIDTPLTAYMTIRNNGDQADKLLKVSSPIAGNIVLYQSKIENDIASMQTITDGLEIPAHGVVELKPNDKHLMFSKLKAIVQPRQLVTVTLTFQSGLEVSLQIIVVGTTN